MTEYIEREALLLKISRMIDYCKKDNKVNGLTALFQVADAIMDCKSEDVAPVRHGRWEVGYFHDRVCSCCLHPDNDLDDYAHKFCPHCGAIMGDMEV